MNQVGQATLWILASFSFPIAIAVFTERLAVSSHALRLELAANSTDKSKLSCQTIIADPNPPLNVRSSPVVAPDNKLATLPNGTSLSVVDEREGWLRINSPLEGWVYKELTVTSCVNTTDTIVAAAVPSSAVRSDEGAKLLAIATEQYQSGNLSGAVSLIKTISPESSAHTAAQLFILQWQKDWNRAESDYYTAQKALRDRRWQDVLHQVNGYPDIRFWREKLAPMVQQAIKQQQSGGEKGSKK
ncbi:MAG: SH3 domain-containing protein [Leptolyngbyaceae cyanobacterium bins.302]|nr:SH3 domain-containing protein [Leptolyngbyaceae cyanobacterium bins.302]